MNGTCYDFVSANANLICFDIERILKSFTQYSSKTLKLSVTPISFFALSTGDLVDLPQISFKNNSARFLKYLQNLAHNASK